MAIFQIILSTFILTVLSSSVNPVKLSFTLIVLSMNLMTCLYLTMSSVWLSSIFFMIFIGGIMIMFMILSSLLPNEKNFKVNKILLVFPLVLVVVNSSMNSCLQLENMSLGQLKLIFLSNESFEILMMVILLYFFCFVYIITKEVSSLRSFSCYLFKIL